MSICSFGRAQAVAWAACALAFAVPVFAQTGVRVAGRLQNSLSGDAVAGASVVIEELKLQVTSAADGTFTIENVPPGNYHLVVRGQGYAVRRAELSAGPAGASVNVTIDPEIHFEEVLSVSPEGHSAFESYQATSVLSGQELTKELKSSLGESLQNQPGVAVRSFGSAPSRPVIRGFDGDRVLILEDGQRGGDLSSQSGDHGVAVNPAAAHRIEVVRGPATLLYGSNAIGGLVNVITDDIPNKKQVGATGTLTFDAGSAAREGGGAGDMTIGNGRFALHAGGAGRRAGDYHTPSGRIPNSQSRSALGNAGVSWTGQKTYLGGSYGYDDSKYGAPFVESGETRLTPRRHSVSVRAGGSDLSGAFDSFRATVGVRRYTHDELDGEVVATTFYNNTIEAEGLGSHRAFGRLKGSVGAWAMGRAFSATGEETLSPPVDQRAFAGFAYEELTWPHATLQFGARVEHAAFAPVGEPHRDFTNTSGSVGLLLKPVNDKVTVAVSLAHAVRNPALEELYYFGVHAGNAAFEVGNSDLGSERGLGFDASLRWRAPRLAGELTFFRNDISDYIFRNPISEAEFLARLPEFGARFPGRTIAVPEEAEFQFVENTAADSLLQGVEFHTDIYLTQQLVAETALDYVRGSLKATGDPLPRMPPFRFRGGLRYQHNAFQAGGDWTVVAGQNRVFGEEQPTDGYDLVKLFASYSFTQGRVLHTVTARLENLTDELYRNHLSFIKELAPEMGRNVRLVYNVKF